MSGKILKNVGSYASATLISRILGLVRTVLMARILGGGVLMTAWGYLITIPNLFRRLMGEGALGTALVPIISYTLEHENRKSARAKLAKVIVFSGGILGFLCLLISLFSFFAVDFAETKRVKMIFEYLPLIIPYMFFICLVGVLSSVLNSIGRFFLPALGAVIFNICLIAALLLMKYSLFDDSLKLRTLSSAVLISGIIQLFLMFILLYREKMLPSLSSLKPKQIKKNPVIDELWHLTLPGIIGASALQFSVLVDRSLACWLSEYALPSLLFSDRLVYLPVGLLAVSFGAVSLSGLSKKAAKNNFVDFIEDLSFSLRHIIFLCIPITAFIFLFGKEILSLLYLGGNFTEQNLSETYLALKFYVFGIPAFAALKVSVSAFNARKKMKIPVRVSIFCILLNIILNLILMWPLKQGGIALATVISSFINNFILIYILKKEFDNLKIIEFLKTAVFTSISAVAALLPAYYIYNFIEESFQQNSFWINLSSLSAGGILFLFIFSILSMITGQSEISEIIQLTGMKKKNT